MAMTSIACIVKGLYPPTPTNTTAVKNSKRWHFKTKRRTKVDVLEQPTAPSMVRVEIKEPKKCPVRMNEYLPEEGWKVVRRRHQKWWSEC